jgi:hypothetical protein
MNIKEILIEAATSVVYHYSSVYNADKILKDGAFRLSSTVGNRSEAGYAPKGYPYFLSTTRSKVGDYHRYVGSGGVMFVLDGNWLSSRYPVKPIDYWNRAWQHSPDRTREAEDRVFSKQASIPIDCVTAIHVFLEGQEDRHSARVRGILLQAKKLGIRTYLYNDMAAWRLQDTRKALTIGKDTTSLRGPTSTGYSTRPVRGINGYGASSLLKWIELIRKQPGVGQPLSKDADKLRYNLQYYGDMGNQLGNDLSNARKPDASDYQLAVKMTDFMNKNNLDVPKLTDLLKAKWKGYKQ